MDEQFLHYIWKYQKFEISQLQLTNGQTIRVFHPGNHNLDSGPDFEEAKIKIGTIQWAGQVEIHINSSDWYRHNHHTDKAYENVILHVVWKHDQVVKIGDETIPTLELINSVDLSLLDKYRKHVLSADAIPCASLIAQLPEVKIRSMLDRALIERLEQKSKAISISLKQLSNDWEEITYRTLAANFGFSTNKESFVRLSQLLPFKILKKVLHHQKSTEAVLFGQAGFLEKPIDSYHSELRSEFNFQRKKHKLKAPLSTTHWKFGKLRPGNFPTVRLSQLSSLLHHCPQLFSLMIKTKDVNHLKSKLMVSLSGYWQRHYDFGKPYKTPYKRMGLASFENLLVNTVAPLLAAYASFTNEQKYMDRAIDILEATKAEHNRVTKKWKAIGMKNETAFDSQALIQLYRAYCQKRRCLHCNIGMEILHR